MTKKTVLLLSLQLILLLNPPFRVQCFQENIDCFNSMTDPKGLKYRGNVSLTKEGFECQKWNSQFPNTHDRTADRYPDAGLGDHNFCRNPDELPDEPWCYNGEGGEGKPRWATCGVPHCSDFC